MNILGFLGASILLTLMPGPDILFVITQSLSQGKKAGIVFALGLCTGLIAHTSAAALGLTLIIYSSEIAFKTVQYAGAAYLLYLAWQIFKNRNQQIDFSKANKSDYVSLYKRGIVMNILNPKVSLFFVAFLPQFVNLQSENIAAQMMLLGAIFIIQAILVFSGVSILADTLAGRITKNKRMSLFFSWIQIVLFFTIALNIVINSLI